jgi:glycosyltransferase involved in cell wall biosynthesis
VKKPVTSFQPIMSKLSKSSTLSKHSILSKMSIIGIDASRAFVEDKTGTETYSLELIKAMLALPEAKKYRFRLYTRVPIRTVLVSLQGQSLKDNVEVVPIPWKRFWTQGGLAAEIMKKPPDTLFIPAHTLPLLRPRGMKTVVTIHGLEYEYLPEYYQFPQKLLLNRSTEYAVKKADQLIAVSNWTKSQLVERLGADPNKITVIHEGVGERFLRFRKDSPYGKRTGLFSRQVRYKYGLPKKYLLFVGTIQPRKNLVRLIEAFAKTVPERKLYLVIAGKKGWMTDEIYVAPQKYGVKNQVKFIGRVADADLPTVYGLSTAFVWPSLMEGFGLPLLEAMACGVPVITSSRGALPEVAGDAALIVDPEKVADLTKAMKLVLENADLSQVLVEKGYRNLTKFSWAEAAQKTLSVLK